MNIKVAMFSYYFPPQYSGSALQAISLAGKLKSRGIEVVFFTVNHDGLPDAGEVQGFRVYRITEGRGRFGEIMLWKNMLAILKYHKDSFDIIHSHGGYLRNSFVGPLSRVLNKKSLVKISLADNDLHDLGKGRSGWLHKRFISVIDRYVSISSEITSELKNHGLPDKKIREIPNGVDTERFSQISHEEKIILRRKFGLPIDSLMLLYAGVIDERKNVKWLIERWNNICHDYPGFLVIAGPVSRDDKNMKLYNSLKSYEDILKGSVYFIRDTDKIEDLYNMADIFVLPSTNEGMPNVILEAMASGLSCLVNKVSGAEDVINGENGMFFDVEKPETFLRGLSVLKDCSVRAEIGKNARESVVRDFSIESVADKYINLYKEMLSS